MSALRDTVSLGAAGPRRLEYMTPGNEPEGLGGWADPRDPGSEAIAI
jgi:hypothetical protein